MSTGTCFADGNAGACASGLTEQCNAKNPWNGGIYFLFVYHLFFDYYISFFLNFKVVIIPPFYHQLVPV
jgi:hypothetical protein